VRNIFSKKKVAIIGGGRVCKAILEILLDPSFEGYNSGIRGVADTDESAEGMVYAREKGIFTTCNYRELFRLSDLDIIIELTCDNDLIASLQQEIPDRIRLVDHFEAMSVWDFLQIEKKKREIGASLHRKIKDRYSLDDAVSEDIKKEFDEFSTRLSDIVSERTSHLQAVEKDLLWRDKAISQIIEGNTIPTFVLDNNHVVTHWNRALEKITGYAAHEMIGTKNHWKAFYPRKKECMADLIIDGVDEESINRFFDGRSKPSSMIRGAYQTEDFFPNMGKKGKWLSFTAAPIVGPDGEIVGSIETLWDTTEHKDAADKLKELEALEASILESISIAVLVLRERRIIFANEAVKSIFGWEPEDLIGQSTRCIYKSYGDYAEVGRVFYQALTHHRSYSAELQCRRKDGREITCMVRTARVGDSLKEKTVVATYEDITERKQAERELKKRERTLHEIIQGSTIPTFVIDKNHYVTHWNKALERLTGHAATDIIGTRMHWKAFYRDEKPIMADLIVDRIPAENLKKYYGDKGGSSPFIEGAYEAELYYPHIGPGGKWLYFTAAPIKDSEGEIIGAIETLWDTTDSNLLKAEREKHISQLSSLWKITSALSESLDLDESLHNAVTGIINNLSVDSVGIYLREDDSDFRIAYSLGYSEDYLKKGNGVGPDFVIDQVAESGEPVIYENISPETTPHAEFALKEGVKCAAYIPLTSKEGVFGVIRISSHEWDSCSAVDKNLLAIISNRIAVAIENARLHREIKMYGQSLEVKVKEKTAKLEESYREIMRSEEKYRTMFDADPTPIIIADRHTLKIMDVNATAEECYGYTRDEFLVMSFTDLSYQPDNRLIDDIKGLVLHESRFFPKRIHKRSDGHPFYVNVHLRLVRFMGKDSLIATTPDITENVEKESQLIQASKMATLGQMASGIAHEINQPLNVIQVCSDFFKKKIVKGEEIEKDDLFMMAEEIGRNVDRAAQTIEHMRDFSRQSDVKRDLLNVNVPITDVFKILGQQLRVHRIDIITDLDPDLAFIIADHNRLEQVFINLVTNAMDALDEKEEHWADREWNKILKVNSFQEKGDVVVTVCDNGIGMPAEIQDKVFEPFFTTKEVGKGTGLGMSISYGIIQDYNGTIDVESEYGKGTTFTIRFPIAQSAGDDNDGQ